MNKADAAEATKIVHRMMDNLLTIIPSPSEGGPRARMLVGQVKAETELLLFHDAIGEPLITAFDSVKKAGATWQQFESVRIAISNEVPKTLGGILIKNCGEYLCLAEGSEIISALIFKSRQDVDYLLEIASKSFNGSEETAADEMDQATYQDLISLHAALVNHLITTARPLPRMINYQFADVLPSLVISYRLYADASRADEIVEENKIIHPLFCPTEGKGLSQ